MLCCMFCGLSHVTRELLYLKLSVFESMCSSEQEPADSESALRHGKLGIQLLHIFFV